jgi:nucleoside-diphosphate-sugar epimerase
MLLVTGGGGFVMSHLVGRWLARDPNARVVVVDRSPMNPALAQLLGESVSRVEWLEADVLDTADVLGDTARESIEYVVHGAAVTSINRYVHADGHGKPGLSGARSSISTNVDGALSILGLASKLPALKRLINVSSGSVYADKSTAGLAVPEDRFVNPEDIYGITKYTAELFTRFASKQLGLPATSVRLSGVFGPMDRETSTRTVVCIPNAIAQAAITGKKMRVRALEAVGDFIHADDVGDAIIALLEASKINFDAYNIAAGKTVQIGELLSVAKRLYPHFEFEELGAGPVDIDYLPTQRSGRWGAYDLARISSDTDWQPRDVEDSFSSYIEFVAAREA